MKGSPMVGFIILISALSGITCGVAGFFLARKNIKNSLHSLVNQAEATARAIKLEAQEKIQEREIQLREREIYFKHEMESQYKQQKREKEELLSEIREQKKDLEKLKVELLSQEEKKHQLISSYEKLNLELIQKLSTYTELTQEEGKLLLLSQLEENLKSNKAKLIRRYENEALELAKQKANYIIAQATTRYAGEFASEKLTSVVHLPNDEMKGKIIGKEGRNIKTFEMISGVDVIVDDTPGSILLSNFNLYRRAVAVHAMEKLIEDGRIQPSNIEDLYAKASKEMEDKVLEEGKKIVLDLGLHGMHTELISLIGKLRYRASFGQNALAHSIEVAKLARIMASELGGDPQMACRAGLLHDIGKVLSQERIGSHVTLGADICRKYGEPPTVINAILSHHGDEKPHSIESCVVCAADALSAGRPGARKEVLENFLNRMQDIEKIALSKFGVQQAYALSAGREIRVIAKADLIDDDGVSTLAYDIARDIEEKLHYPGEIKVNVIREIRGVNFAR